MSDLTAVDVAVSPETKFREYLMTQGMRLTTERETIVREVFASHEHFDADQLVSRLNQRTDGKRVSRSTVYRALAQLKDSGLLRAVARPNDREVYEHDYGYPQHDHLICKECGDLIEFVDDSLNEMLSRVAAQNGFRISAHRLEVYGKCANCCRPKRRQRKTDMI
ncbi:Ferric uptake regulation protein [Symmachiella macrocystis]|uniref:Ferric uptake regulation protein n=1 Tax=Symmachiella macrocystis TaxID=2527985 RepID=A0A5C6BA72_9PLAN|nr:Fur family transcriptional regulator [Symmachiella macrocystis]TWU09175.1 Ferric uptake regulation protein [Symmachiella macrocystis]